MYSVIGDFQASFYFGVDSNTGVITVRNNLLNDIVEDYTVRRLTSANVIRDRSAPCHLYDWSTSMSVDR